MEYIKTFESFINESKFNKNNSNAYPLKNEKDIHYLLSGRSVRSDRARKMVSDLIDVYGNDASILSDDIVTTYLQTNSTDSSLIYKVVRRNLQFSRTFYIPSKYRNTDQDKEIQKAL